MKKIIKDGAMIAKNQIIETSLVNSLPQELNKVIDTNIAAALNNGANDHFIMPKGLDLAAVFQMDENESFQNPVQFLQQKFIQSLTVVGVGTDNAFLSVENLLFPYDGIFSAFQKAFFSYLQLDEGSFAQQIAFVGEYSGIQAAPNFLNLTFEQLFDVPVAEGGSEVTAITFEGGVGLVESIGYALNLELLGHNSDIISVTSVAQTLSTPPPIFTTTKPVTPTPPIVIPLGTPVTPTQTIDDVMSHALNFARSINYTGNIFTAGPYNNNSVASFGSDGGSIISASFASSIPGSSVNTKIRGETILTLPDGNYLTFYTANVNGHKVGDYVYTLISPHLISSTTASIEIIDGQRFFVDSFEYTLTSNRFVTSTGTIDVITQDDHPTASNMINPTAILEANIVSIGSNLPTIPNQLLGGLLTSPTAANPNYFGANGGSVSNVSIAGGTTTIGTLTITVIDPYGNTLVIDKATGKYTYTLSHAIPNVNDQPITEVFQYVLTDKNGNHASANLTITIQDDKPVAVDENAGTILEANIPIVGSDAVTTVNLLGGLLVPLAPTTSTARYGADGAAVSGGVTAVSLTSVGGVAAVTEASNTVGKITQLDIDNSQGLLAQSELDNKAILVIDSLGNVLIVDVMTGQYVYTLSQAFNNIPANSTAMVTFSYTLTDADGSTSTANLTIQVIDDKPHAVALDAGTIVESHIPVVGSDGVTGPDTLSGNLISASTSHYGADGPAVGGGISNVILSTVVGANAVSATTIAGLINQQQINNSNGAFTQANLGDKSLIVTDALGNVLVVDAQTNEYLYTLNKAFTQTNPDTTATVNYIVTYRDSDGSEASNTLSIHVADDHPIAIADTNSIVAPALPSSQVIFGSIDAGYDDSFGYYIKDSNGLPTTGVVIWAGGHETPVPSNFTISGVDAANIGYFIIPNGGTLNSTLANGEQVTFAEISGLWQAISNTNQQTLQGQGAFAFFDNSSLNADGISHVSMMPNHVFGWEDLYGGGDRDFNDVVVTVINQNQPPTGGATSQVMGNILTNDIRGADGNVRVVDLSINFSSVALATSYIADHANLNASLNGTSVVVPIPDNTTVSIPTPEGGTLQLSSDGNYTFTISNSTTVGTETFGYQIVDGDNSPSSSTLSIQITGTSPEAAITPFHVVASTAAEISDSPIVTSHAMAATIVSSDLFSKTDQMVNFSNVHHMTPHHFDHVKALPLSDVAVANTTNENPLTNKDVFSGDNVLNFSKLESGSKFSSVKEGHSQHVTGENPLAHESKENSHQPSAAETTKTNSNSDHLSHASLQPSASSGDEIAKQIEHHLTHIVHHGG